MKTLQNLYCLLSLVPLSMFGYAGSLPADQKMAANIYRTISVKSCDSLIKANELNPIFIILDVRTPDVWAADHLTGSINRNYYDADFNAQLNALPKQKTYLLHCQSGARSAPTFSMMKSLGFAEVYEMSGGINAWKSGAYPTTSKVAPRLMLISNGGSKKGTLKYGLADTLIITITNRANDTLKFTSVTLPAGSEFSTNFDMKKKLTGTADYTFSLYYKPLQIHHDSVYVNLISNGGNLKLGVFIKKETVFIDEPITRNKIEIFPNPANSMITVVSPFGAVVQTVTLLNLKGQPVKKEILHSVSGRIYITDVPEGLYFVYVTSGDRTLVNKLLIKR